MDGVVLGNAVLEGDLHAGIGAHAQQDADLAVAPNGAVGDADILEQSRAIGITQHDTAHVARKLRFCIIHKEHIRSIKGDIFNSDCTVDITDEACAVKAAIRAATYLHVPDGMAVTVHDNTGKPLIAVNGLPQVLTQIHIIGEIQGITAVILTVVRDFLGKQGQLLGRGHRHYLVGGIHRRGIAVRRMVSPVISGKHSGEGREVADLHGDIAGGGLVHIVIRRIR